MIFRFFGRTIATFAIVTLTIPHSLFADQSDVINAVNQIRLSDPNVPVGTANPRGLVGTIIDNIFYPSGVKQGKIRPEYLDVTPGNAAAGTLADLNSAGTVGYIPKYTGTGMTIGNSVMMESGGNIGIGTANPSSKLEVRDGHIRLSNSVNGFMYM
jgi:hypothetical protein